jgi:ParB-like chromosome segregation protein Spo0J
MPTAVRIEKINPTLARLVMPIGKLRADPRNPRRHDDRSIAAIAESLRLFGQQKPVVVRGDGMIVAGNGTWRAAKTLGWTRLAAVRFDRKSKAAVRGYAIADNRTAELSRWNDLELRDSLDRLSKHGVDLGSLGFSREEYAALLERIAVQDPVGVTFPEFDESIAGDVRIEKCPKCGGDVPV